MPAPIQKTIVSGLGLFAYASIQRRRKIAQTNIRLCFPNLSKNDQDNLVKAIFISTAESFFLTARSFWYSDKQFNHPFHISGLEAVQKALTEGPVLLLGAHFSGIDWYGRILGKEIPLGVVYRPHEHPIQDQLLKYYRSRWAKAVIAKQDARGMYHCLKNNIALWYSPDQDLGIKQGEFVPFFGIPTATLTTPCRMAQKINAQVFFISMQKTKELYEIQCYKPESNFIKDNDIKCMTEYNQWLQACIEKHPEQYLWLHKRFKTRPENHSGFY